MTIQPKGKEEIPQKIKDSDFYNMVAQTIEDDWDTGYKRLNDFLLFTIQQATTQAREECIKEIEKWFNTVVKRRDSYGDLNYFCFPKDLRKLINQIRKGGR